METRERKKAAAVFFTFITEPGSKGWQSFLRQRACRGKNNFMPGANPTIASYNAGMANFYDATNTIARL
jgi:hypothetical protein